MSEIEFSSEIEDLINPTDELKKKIVAVASTIRKWNNETARVRKTVKSVKVGIFLFSLTFKYMSITI
jgi:hypothetical protein